MDNRKTAVGPLIAVLVLALFCAEAYAGGADYEKGVAYLRAGRADEAIKYLEPLGIKEPGDALVQYHLGLAYYKSDRLDKAFESFARARAASKDGGREYGLAVAFCNVGIGNYRKKDYDRAAASFKAALELDPADGDSHYYMGLVKVEQQDYLAALKELGQAAASKPADNKEQALVHNAVGMVYFRQEKTSTAIDEFGKTLAIEPGNIEALYYLGLLNYKDNGYAAARPYFDKIALMGAPDEKTRQSLFTTFFNMGVDFQNRDKAEAATEMFEKASGLRPSDPDAHFYRGYNLMLLERYEDAVPEFRQALALKPDMSRAQARLEVSGKFAAEKVLKDARARMGDSDYYAAYALYERAARFDPANGEAKKGLKQASELVDNDTRKRVEDIKAHMGRGEQAEAVKGAEELVRLNPGSAEASSIAREAREMLAAAKEEYFGKARDAEGRDALDDAAGYYEKVVKIDPKDQQAADALKKVKARMEAERERDAEFARLMDKARDAYDAGDLSKAAASVDKALELSPQNKEARELGRKVSARSQERAAQPAPSAPVSAGTEDEVRRLYLQGVDQYTKGHLQDAVSAWRQVLKLDPGNEKAASSIEKAEQKLKESQTP